MLYRVYSDLPSFKTVEFHEGLNILLSDREQDSSEQQTRNRAGKTSLIELIHFLLGAEADKSSLFRWPQLEQYTFGMDMDFGGQRVSVKRSGQSYNQILTEGSALLWPAGNEVEAISQSRNLNLKQWKDVLAHQLFGIENDGTKSAPTARALLRYLARKDRDGGMLEPTRQFRSQKPVEYQVNLSFLLGLDWRISQNWQQVRDREKELKQLQSSLRSGVLGRVVEKASTLRTKLVIAQEQLDSLRRQLQDFQVLEDYKNLESEASSLTDELNELSNENALDQLYLAKLAQAVESEVPPTPEGLDRVYQEAGVVFPDGIMKRFEEVRSFHESVVRNRKEYLATEITDTEKRIKNRNVQKSELSRQRAEIMRILDSSGALDHFSALQGRASKLEAEVENLRSRFEAAETLESESLTLKDERIHLQTRLRRDLSEREEIVGQAILRFQEISTSLYEEGQAGSLTLEATENGLDFNIEIHGAMSKGVNNMQIFSFDMMLTVLGMQRQHHPGFLVHDSHLFDGVDERQVARALDLGAKLSAEFGFQYIVTMNSDQVPTQLPEGFDLESFALSTKLTDSAEDGGLFGFRFDGPSG